MVALERLKFYNPFFPLSRTSVGRGMVALERLKFYDVNGNLLGHSGRKSKGRACAIEIRPDEWRLYGHSTGRKSNRRACAIEICSRSKTTPTRTTSEEQSSRLCD